MRVLDPADADLSATSIVKFLKLADDHGLTVHVRYTRSYSESTYYLSKSKTHSVGELKEEGREVDWVFITITNQDDFGAAAVWKGGTFDSCFIGGKRSGHRPEKLFTQSTKMMEEIKRCLS